MRYPTRLLSYSPRYKCTSVEFFGSTKKYVNNLRAEHLVELDVVSIHRVIKRKIKRDHLFDYEEEKTSKNAVGGKTWSGTKRSVCVLVYLHVILCTYATFSDGGG